MPEHGFYPGGHKHDVLVDEVHFPGVKMQISPKLDLYCTNQYKIRNQRLQLRKNTLF